MQKDLGNRIDRICEEMRYAFGIPGLAVAVVRDDFSHVGGYGVRELGQSHAVDADTLFNVCSTTKAFTATSIGFLVQDGIVGWDDLLIDHMPWFRLSDPGVTMQATIRDLLSNRLGVDNGPFLKANARSRRDFVERFRHLPFAQPFRSGFYYFNDGFVAAGLLVEEVTGQSWESFIRERLLDPLSMKDSGPGIEQYHNTNNRVSVHSAGCAEGTFEVISPEWYAASKGLQEPAGGMFLTMRDACKWLSFNLSRGQAGGRQILAPAIFDELFKPVTLSPDTSYFTGSHGYADPDFYMGDTFYGYSLGWGVTDFRGRTVLSHEGANPGVRAVSGLIPSLNAGFYAGFNAEGNFSEAMIYALVDLLVGEADHQWPARLAEVAHTERAQIVAHKAAVAAGRKAHAPALPLSEYAGDYADDGLYGGATVTCAEDGASLILRFGIFTFRLDPWQGERFAATWLDRWMTPPYSDYDSFLTFRFDSKGNVSGFDFDTFAPVKMMRQGA